MYNYDNPNKPVKITISYMGTRQLKLEEKIKSLAEKHGGSPAGEWGYNERSFECLFRFKRQRSFDAFQQEINRELANNFGYQKLNFGLSS